MPKAVYFPVYFKERASGDLKAPDASCLQLAVSAISLHNISNKADTVEFADIFF
jgi:hypothetical protein